MAGRKYRRVRVAGQDFPSWMLGVFGVGTAFNWLERKHLQVLWRKYGSEFDRRYEEENGKITFLGYVANSEGWPTEPMPTDSEVAKAIQYMEGEFPIAGSSRP